MTDQHSERQVIRARDFTPEHNTAGVLLPRFCAYVIDLSLVGLLVLVAVIAVSVLGVLTFGFGWMLFPIVGIGTAMAYAAITIGGRHQATIGMRVCGLRVTRFNGGAADGITAAAHCLLFYAATLTMGLLLLTIIIGIVRRDGRMGHDLLTGLVLVRD